MDNRWFFFNLELPDVEGLLWIVICYSELLLQRMLLVCQQEATVENWMGIIFLVSVDKWQVKKLLEVAILQ